MTGGSGGLDQLPAPWSRRAAPSEPIEPLGDAVRVGAPRTGTEDPHQFAATDPVPERRGFLSTSRRGGPSRTPGDERHRRRVASAATASPPAPGRQQCPIRDSPADRPYGEGAS